MQKISPISSWFKSYQRAHNDEISGVVFAVNEAHATKKLARPELSGVQLMVVYPSGVGTGDSDNGVMVTALVVFVLEKVTSDAMDEGVEELLYAKLQNIILNLRDAIMEESSTGCGLFSRLRISTSNIEPEYNIAKANGWSMDLQF